MINGYNHLEKTFNLWEFVGRFSQDVVLRRNWQVNKRRIMKLIIIDQEIEFNFTKQQIIYSARNSEVVTMDIPPSVNTLLLNTLQGIVMFVDKLYVEYKEKNGH